jgi:hypothetical protein
MTTTFSFQLGIQNFNGADSLKWEAAQSFSNHANATGKVPGGPTRRS